MVLDYHSIKLGDPREEHGAFGQTPRPRSGGGEPHPRVPRRADVGRRPPEGSPPTQRSPRSLRRGGTWGSPPTGTPTTRRSWGGDSGGRGRGTSPGIEGALRRPGPRVRTGVEPRRDRDRRGASGRGTSPTRCGWASPSRRTKPGAARRVRLAPALEPRQGRAGEARSGRRPRESAHDDGLRLHALARQGLHPRASRTSTSKIPGDFYRRYLPEVDPAGTFFTTLWVLRRRGEASPQADQRQRDLKPPKSSIARTLLRVRLSAFLRSPARPGLSRKHVPTRRSILLPLFYRFSAH